jgi:hypothetical protein
MDIERFRQFALLVVVAIYILLLGGGAFIALRGIEPQRLQGVPEPSIAPPTPAPSIIKTNPAIAGCRLTRSSVRESERERR